MRKLLGLVAGSMLLAGTAHASTLPFGGALVFQLATLPGLVGPGGSLAIVNASVPGTALGGFAITGGVFGPVTASVPVTSNATINSVIFTALDNLPGSFTGLAAAPGGGPMGLSGMAKICLVFSNPGTCDAAVSVPLTPSGGTGFGVGGTQVIPGAVSITMQHNPWTIGQPTMTIHSPGTTVTTPALPGGFAHGPATGGASSAAQPGGVVQLVTVSKTYTSLAGAFPELPLIGLLNITFVPEPGTLLLLGSGVVGLAILGRKRARK